MFRLYVAGVLVVVSAALTASGCGGDDPNSAFASRAAPPASDFPSAGGRSLSQIVSQAEPTQDLVVAPTSSVFERGRNRYAFGVFTAAREEVTDAQVALYAAPHGGGPAIGPFPARVESLAVDRQFESQTTSQDPQAAHVVYVANVSLNRDGPWDVVALIKQGNSLQSTLTPTIEVGAHSNIPRTGQRPPGIHTPTVQDVGGDISQIDTRSPHDDMHDVDFADDLGKKPVVLLFATPALCQSRVCGPVVDVAEQVKSEFADKGIDFIHMEVYNDNNPNDGLRPQLKAFHLPTEPWLFVIGRDGRISTRIEGAFGASEMESAVRKVAGS